MELNIFIKEIVKKARVTISQFENIAELKLAIANQLNLPDIEKAKRSIKFPNGDILDDELTIEQCGIKSYADLIFDFKSNAIIDLPKSDTMLNLIDLNVFSKEIDKKIILSLKPDTLISELINCICKKLNFSENQIEKRCIKLPNDQILDDKLTIEQCGLISGAFINLDFRPSDVIDISKPNSMIKIISINILLKEADKKIKKIIEISTKIEDLIQDICEKMDIPANQITKKCLKHPNGLILDDKLTIDQCGLKSNSLLIFDSRPIIIDFVESFSSIQLNLFIKEQNNEEIKAIIDISTSIEELINTICEKYNIPEDERNNRCIKLFSDEILDNELTIEECGLESDTFLIFDYRTNHDIDISKSHFILNNNKITLKIWISTLNEQKEVDVEPFLKISNLISKLVRKFGIPKPEKHKEYIKLLKGEILDDELTIEECGLKADEFIIFDFRPIYDINEFKSNNFILNDRFYVKIFIKERNENMIAELESCAKIIELIVALCEKLNIPKDEICKRSIKLFNDEILDNESTIEQYDLESGTFIIFDYRPIDIIRIILDIYGKNAYEVEVCIVDNLFCIGNELYKQINNISNAEYATNYTYFINKKQIDPMKSLVELNIKDGMRIYIREKVFHLILNE